MEKKNYQLGDVKVGNQVKFTRSGIDDFNMYWTVVGFHNEMIRVKIDEMGFKDELFIEASDIELLLNVNDSRYNVN